MTLIIAIAELFSGALRRLLHSENAPTASLQNEFVECPDCAAAGIHDWSLRITRCVCGFPASSPSDMEWHQNFCRKREYQLGSYGWNENGE